MDEATLMRLHQLVRDTLCEADARDRRRAASAALQILDAELSDEALAERHGAPYARGDTLREIQRAT